MELFQEKLGQVREEIRKVIVGKDEIIDAILMTVLANGHVLLEDIPGVGKTTLALAFSKTLSLQYHRMQFTPDVLPADVTGFSMYNKRTEEFEYREGAVMCNLFLADEINRTSPKTQSALLEVMEEGKVTVDGVTRTLPQPFFVIATQNPLGSAGTQKLPESQLDRFMVKLSMGYPDVASEAQILKEENQDRMTEVAEVMSLGDIIEIQKLVRELHVEDCMYRYIADLMAATRTSEWLKSGVSPRGAKALLRMARARAYMEGRNYVVPEDVLNVLSMVCCHRVTLSAKAKAEGRREEEIIKELAKGVPMPRVGGE
ncbi:MAG: MoxR family ATPase [Lachnospiraceae bacterium]|nr:MoxR family ATPase [Lachnospiraceae bacterium]